MLQRGKKTQEKRIVGPGREQKRASENPRNTNLPKKQKKDHLVEGLWFNKKGQVKDRLPVYGGRLKGKRQVSKRKTPISEGDDA